MNLKRAHIIGVSDLIEKLRNQFIFTNIFARSNVCMFFFSICRSSLIIRLKNFSGNHTNMIGIFEYAKVLMLMSVMILSWSLFFLQNSRKKSNSARTPFESKGILAELDLFFEFYKKNEVQDYIITDINIKTLAYIKICQKQKSPRNNMIDITFTIVSLLLTLTWLRSSWHLNLCCKYNWCEIHSRKMLKLKLD